MDRPASWEHLPLKEKTKETKGNNKKMKKRNMRRKSNDVKIFGSFHPFTGILVLEIQFHLGLHFPPSGF